MVAKVDEWVSSLVGTFHETDLRSVICGTSFLLFTDESASLPVLLPCWLSLVPGFGIFPFSNHVLVTNPSLGR